MKDTARPIGGPDLPAAPSIEVADPSHEASVVELLRRQFEEHSIELGESALCRGVKGLLEDSSRGFVLLAHDGEQPVGLACVPLTWTLEHGGLSAWLDELYVVPEHRARGLGTALLRAVCAEATARGCAALDLEVDEDHVRAARLYAREGFCSHRRSRWVKRLEPHG